MQGYTEAADLTNEAELKEPEEDIRNDLPDGFRVVSNLDKDGSVIEREVESGERWIELAVFTSPNASFDWAEEMAGNLPNDFRVIFDWTQDDWKIEVLTEDE